MLKYKHGKIPGGGGGALGYTQCVLVLTILEVTSFVRQMGNPSS